jgi:hypothetical protein
MVVLTGKDIQTIFTHVFTSAWDFRVMAIVNASSGLRSVCMYLIYQFNTTLLALNFVDLYIPYTKYSMYLDKSYFCMLYVVFAQYRA